jgi:hypothetical protein
VNRIEQIAGAVIFLLALLDVFLTGRWREKQG